MHAVKPKRSEHETTQLVQRANRRAEMRLQLVTAMLVMPVEDGIDIGVCIRTVDRIIDALEARHAAERRGD